MAKAESGLRNRIKKALEADGWSVITQHGSAYNRNVLDLTVVLACLEVKTDNGRPTAGQRNTIRKLRKQGIPAGIVRSVEEARQGMALVKQGVRQMAVDEPVIDLDYLNSLLDGSAVATEPAPDQTQADVAALPSQPEPPQTLDNLLGMQGQFETFETTPAPEEPEPSAIQQGLTSENLYAPAADKPAPEVIPAAPAPAGMGVLEEIVFRLRHIDQLLSGLVAGLSADGVPEFHSTAAEQPVRRRRRTRAQIEADEAAAREAAVE